MVAIYTIVVALLMVSRLPTLSGKRFGQRIPRERVLPVLVIGVLLVALLASYPFSFLATAAVAYLAHIPFAWRARRGRGEGDARPPRALTSPATDFAKFSRLTSQFRAKKAIRRLAEYFSCATQQTRAGRSEPKMIPSLLRTLAISVAAFFVVHAAAHAEDKLRFIIVTHGAATDRFWSSVKEGADSAAKEAGVSVVYRAPRHFDLDKMAALVEAAVKEAPDGLIVSIPNADALAPPIRAAVDAGIPVITINSGFDVSHSLGALLHVGQSEYEAGRVAGDTMRSLGGKKALCLNHELGNVALDLRCKGFIDGFAGSVEVVPVDPDPKKAGKTIADRLAEDTDIDAILALSATSAGEPAVAAAKALEGRKVQGRHVRRHRHHAERHRRRRAPPSPSISSRFFRAICRSSTLRS